MYVCVYMYVSIWMYIHVYYVKLWYSKLYDFEINVNNRIVIHVSPYVHMYYNMSVLWLT